MLLHWLRYLLPNILQVPKSEVIVIEQIISFVSSITCHCIHNKLSKVDINMFFFIFCLSAKMLFLYTDVSSTIKIRLDKNIMIHVVILN